MKTPDPNKLSSWEARIPLVRWRYSCFQLVTLILALLAPTLASAAGPAVQLLWSVQPGSANAGAPFGQQPTLVTADANGNPSTIGLGGTVNVTIDTVPTGGLNGGARTVNIGTSGANGVISFSDLQINSAGGFSLTAISGNGTNQVFSPTNIATCQLWLDANDAGTLTLTNTSNVSSWLDKSGTGNNATNITGDGISNTPLTNSNPDLISAAPYAYGAGRVLSFYGTNRLNIDLTRITNSTFSIFAVTELQAGRTANNDYYIGTPFFNPGSGPGNGGVDCVLHVGYRNSTQYTFSQYADDLNVSLPPAGPLVASHIHGSGSKAIYFNGALAGSGGGSHLVVVSQGNIGQGNGGNFNGDIAEVIVYNTNLTDLQRVRVENYLLNKWKGQFSAAKTSASFFVSSGEPPAGMYFSQQPGLTTAGVNLSPSITVTVTNAVGAGIPNLQVFISLADGSASGTLGGTLSQITDANGVATFSDLNLTVAGQYQLEATIPGVLTTDSSLFNVVAAAPSQLVVTTQPSSPATAGVIFGTQPVVAIEDAYGNIVLTASDVITASETAGGNLSGTLGNSVQMAAISGVATFSGLYVTNSGTQTLTFTEGALTVNSANITVTPAGISSPGLTIQQQPSSTAQVGVPFATQPVLQLADAFGNPATNNTPVVVTASVGVLLGQTTAYTSNGIVSFTGLTSTNLGNVTLTFSFGAASVNSTPIAISIGPVSTVVWTTQPGSALVGSPFGQQPVLRTADAGGNISTIGLDSVDTVVVHLISGSGLVGDSLAYNIGTSGSNGVITFQNLQIDTPGNDNVLAADYLGAAVNPTVDIGNCILWLDAYDTSTYTLSDTNLTVWADKSGTGNNATNTANYPVTNQNLSLPNFAYGGQHAVSFLGNNWLNVDLSSLTGVGYTVFAVDIATTDAFNGNSYFFGSDYNGVDATLHMGYRSANRFTFAQYADDLDYTAPANFVASTPRLWTGRLNDNTGEQDIFFNGNLVASRFANDVPGTLINAAVGRGNGGNYRGDLAEIIVYNRSLSDTERQEIEQYLQHKWFSNSRGLTAPFTVTGLTPLLSITPSADNTVQLTISGAPGLTYRLLRSSDLSLPINSWTPVGTNVMDGSGTWLITNTVSGNQFYRAVTP